MTEKRQKKYKLLRQRQVVPSVVVLVLYVVLAAFFISMFYSVFTQYFFESKIARTYGNAVYLSDAARVKAADGEDWGDIAHELCIGSMSVDSACFFDADFTRIAGWGNESYILAKQTTLSFGDEKITIVHDGQTDDLIYSEDGELHLPLFTLLGELRRGGQSTLDETFTIHYWISTPVETDGITLLARSELSVSRFELSYVLVIIIMLVALVLIPCALLIINIVNTLHMQKNMKKLFYTDPLTGGHNRYYLEEFAGKLFKGKNALTMTVAVFSLKKFRSYCACHGTAEGEKFLEEIHEELCAQISRGEMCARFNEADFCAVIKCSSREEALERIKSVINAVSEKHGTCYLHWNAGFYMTGENELSGQHCEMLQMINNASSACNSADSYINLPNGSWLAAEYFDQKLLDEQRWEHTVEENMERALANKEFEVYLQPKFSPTDEKLSGAEALIRWVSPEYGFVSPIKFIPIFEKNGFITKIDDYMISSVAKLQAQWLAQGKPVVPVSVNVSRAHFASPDLAEHISLLVDKYNVPHEYIEIELTESAFFDDKDALLNTVMELKNNGFDISMDDFGAGYSSLNSLKDLPLDVLKLDAEFFRGEADGRSEVVVSEAIKLAKSLEMRIVAEGVEKREQVEFLAANGCDMIQGYYYAKPMPAAEFDKKHYTVEES